MNKQTLCWDCENAVGGCSWSREFIPVDGWNAIQTRLKLHNQTGLKAECASYIVITCPGFKKDMENVLKRRLRA